MAMASALLATVEPPPSAPAFARCAFGALGTVLVADGWWLPLEDVWFIDSI